MNEIDNSRSSSIFTPLPSMPMIHVIGVGATGSHIWDQLVCLGYPNMTAWDFDKVEAHNLNNQTYLYEHINIPKVHALKELTEAKHPSASYSYRNTKVTNETFERSATIEGIVVIATDTMASRKLLGAEIHKLDTIQFMVEPRIASKHCNVYAFPPQSMKSYDEWWDTLGDDDDPRYEVSPCGGSISVKPTITLASSLCVWAIIDWINEQAYDFGTNAFVSPTCLGKHKHVPKPTHTREVQTRGAHSNGTMRITSNLRPWAQPPASYASNNDDSSSNILPL
jgi:molybdopterin/thiamine biosynthesis adenylyltransferase